MGPKDIQRVIQKMTADAEIGEATLYFSSPLEQRVDAEADAVGEQIEPCAGIEMGEPVPQRLVVGRNVIAPMGVPVGDLVRCRAVLQLLRLG